MVNQGMQQFDTFRPTACLVGRYQPFYDGHKHFALEAARKYRQIFIRVRHAEKVEQNPFGFLGVLDRIEETIEDFPLPWTDGILQGSFEDTILYSSR